MERDAEDTEDTEDTEDAETRGDAGRRGETRGDAVAFLKESLAKNFPIFRF